MLSLILEALTWSPFIGDTTNSIKKKIHTWAVHKSNHVVSSSQCILLTIPFYDYMILIQLMINKSKHSLKLIGQLNI